MQQPLLLPVYCNPHCAEQPLLLPSLLYLEAAAVRQHDVVCYCVVLPCCRKCKLYRYEASSNEWKERGLGVVKLLKHKENGKIRLLMRQEKTLKIRANHIGA